LVKTRGHSEKGKLVVTMIAVFSARSAMTWKSIGGNLGQCYVTQFIDDEEFHTRPAGQHGAQAMLALCFDQLVDHRGGGSEANSPSLRAAVSPGKIHRLIAELEVAGLSAAGDAVGLARQAGG
jgi:hypothetical protein